MIFNILDNITELYMTKYIIGEFFSSSGATLYKNPSDQTVHILRTSMGQFEFSRLFRQVIHAVRKQNGGRLSHSHWIIHCFII